MNNKKWTAILVDDETRSIESMRSLIAMCLPDLEIVGEASSVVQATQLLQKVTPEILFLDVELKDGLGMEILDHFPDHSFHVVFVTAYDQYAIQALKLRAFDYLLKPVDPDELEQTFEKLQKATSSAVPSNEKTKISVPTQNGSRFLELADIVRLQSDSNYTRIYLKDAKPVLVSRTLKKFEDSITDTRFIRVHRQHLVNLDHIREFNSSEGGYLLMSNADQVPLSKSNKALIERALEFKIIRI